MSLAIRIQLPGLPVACLLGTRADLTLCRHRIPADTPEADRDVPTCPACRRARRLLARGVQ